MEVLEDINMKTYLIKKTITVKIKARNEIDAKNSLICYEKDWAGDYDLSLYNIISVKKRNTIKLLEANKL